MSEERELPSAPCCSVDEAGEVCGTCSPGESEEENIKREFIKIGLGAVLYAVVLVFRFPFWLELFLFLASYFVIAWDIVWKAVTNLFKGEVFDENFLLTVATAGAFAIGKYPEAVAVMLFFKVGELFQDIAIDRSRKSIRSLISIRPDYANLKMDGEVRRVDPLQVKVGDLVVVKPGEKVPLDGVVLEGESMVNTVALTGESVPRRVKPGDEILSGMVNETGLLTVRVTRTFGESTVSKILNLVENAAARKAPTEKFITKFARYYTPAVVLGAVLLAIVPVVLYKIPVLTPFFAHEETFSEWIYKALIFLVISCPCALVISIPLGFFGGIGASSRRGILVKGSNYLEGLNNLHTVVWDKTGTLTKGVFKVTEVSPAPGFSREDLLRFAALAESQSSHPIAKSIVEAFSGEVGEGEIEEYQEIPGHGIKARVGGHRVLVGNDRLLHKEGVEHSLCDIGQTGVHVVVDNVYAGYIVVSDEIKEDAPQAVKELRKLGVKRQLMLTGDSEKTAAEVFRRIGLDEYYAELLPHEKVEIVERLIVDRRNPRDLVAFVGDGINDAPALVRSDIGVAMGALGSDAAIEAADVVLMTDEPSKLCQAVKIARRTRRIVWQNIGLALGVKGVFLTMGALGVATMWEAVFADVGVALMAIFNSMRVMRGGR